MEIYKGRGMTHEHEVCMKMLDEVFFWDEPEESFLALLPKLYKEKYSPSSNNFIVKENDEWCAAVGAFDYDFSVGGKILKCRGIGNVAVSKAHRSKGYMKECMNLAVNSMIDDGVDMSVLGGQRQRYGYFGFESAGVTYAFGVNDKNIKHVYGREKSALTLKLLDENDLDSLSEINKLNEQNTVHVKRRLDSLYDTLISWHSAPYVLWDNNEFAGYFVLHRCHDTITEIGVKNEKYFEEMLIAILSELKMDSCTINVPAFRKDLLKILSKVAENVSVKASDALLILNYERFLDAYIKAKATYQPLCDGRMVFEINGYRAKETLEIIVENNKASVKKTDASPDIVLEHLEATAMFCSAYSPLRDKLPPNIAQWFPLEFYDSLVDHV